MIEFTSCGDACFDRKPDIFPIACRYDGGRSSTKYYCSFIKLLEEEKNNESK